MKAKRKISRKSILMCVLFCFIGTMVMAQGINVDLGKTEQGRYMKLVGNTPGSDGQIANKLIQSEYCAQNVGTAMYFSIDDNYVFKTTGKFFIVNVEYFDSKGAVSMKLVYDSKDNPAKNYSSPITTTGTETWKSFNFFVDDAYFGNRMANGADFSLVCSTGTMSINAVKVVLIDYYIDFGQKNDEYFIHQFGAPSTDSQLDTVTVDGEECYTTAINGSYILLNMDDSVIKDGNHQNLFIAIEFYDSDATNSYFMRYSGMTADRAESELVSFDGWKCWRTHTFEVTDAKFADNSVRSSDFCFRFTRPGIYVNRVMVGVLDREPLPNTSALPTTSVYRASEALDVTPVIDGNLSEWGWLTTVGLLPQIILQPVLSSGVRTDEFYRTWLLNPENVPVAETGEPRVVDPGVPGLWDVADLNGDVTILWDATYLYFGIKIKDNVIDVNGTGWNQKDGVGLYLDVSHDYGIVGGLSAPIPHRDNEDFEQGEHFIFLTATDAEKGWWIHRTSAGEALPETVLKKVIATDSSYVIEAAIPLELLRDGLAWTPGKAGDKDNFNPLFSLLVNDADNAGASSGRLMFSGNSADDEFWGTLNLIDSNPLADGGITVNMGNPNFEQLIAQTEKGGDGLTENAVKGGKSCAKTSAGYAYFNVDDDVVFSGNHKKLLVMIEYFDTAESVKFRLQYDATGAAYKSTPYITVGNTQTWKTVFFEIDDAFLGGRQNGKADLRIHCPTNNLYFNEVRIALRDLYIDFGSTKTMYNLREVTYPTVPDTIGGVDCGRFDGGGQKKPYNYYNVADSVIYNGNHPEIFLSVEYYDTSATSYIQIQYDGQGYNFTRSKNILRTSGTNQWRLFSFYIDDALFGNRSNGNDFRMLFNSGPTQPWGYVNRVMIGVIGGLETGVSVLDRTPNAFSLDQNYPNPFNPTTTIHYRLSRSTDVTLRIYNILGKMVKTLVQGHQLAGEYQAVWDGSDDRGLAVSSGLYIYQFKAGDFIRTYKMVLVK